MSITLNKPMPRDEFLEWAEVQDEFYEFDGEQPILMNGGSLGHDWLQFQLKSMIYNRLSRKAFQVWGPTAGIATIGQRVRFPDVVIARGRAPSTVRLIPDPVAVFEVLSPSSSRIDRIVKLREYGAVESIQSYAILEADSPAITMFHKGSTHQWTATALTIEDVLSLPEIGIELPLAELYADLLS